MKSYYYFIKNKVSMSLSIPIHITLIVNGNERKYTFELTKLKEQLFVVLDSVLLTAPIFQRNLSKQPNLPIKCPESISHVNIIVNTYESNFDNMFKISGNDSFSLVLIHYIKKEYFYVNNNFNLDLTIRNSLSRIVNGSYDINTEIQKDASIKDASILNKVFEDISVVFKI